MKKLDRLLYLSWPDLTLLVEAVLLLGVARIAVLTLPFRRVVRVLAMQKLDVPKQEGPQHVTKARRIGRMIQEASRHLPWECRCLVQAIAGKLMLVRRGITSTVYIGVAKDEHKGFNAHAWLSSRAVTVTGGRGHERFSVIAHFAEGDTRAQQ